MNVRLRRRRQCVQPNSLQWKSAPGTAASSTSDYYNERTDTSTDADSSSLVSRSTVPSESSPIPSPSPASSRPNSPFSPRGNLAFLASRRSSKDSGAVNIPAGASYDRSPSPRGSCRQSERRQSNFLELPVVEYVRPRVSSLPVRGYNPRSQIRDDIYRLRTFHITSKGVVNGGDALIERGSKSNTSMASSPNSRQSNLSGERSPFEGSCCGSSAITSDAGDDDDDEVNESLNLEKFRITLLGAAGVGKSSLLQQFLSSEYINTYDASLDDEFGERTVSVLLEEEESELVFIDHPANEMSVENSMATYEPHGCIVVYSVTDRSSFRAATEILRYLWQEGITKEKAVILAGNKCDLARARVVTTQEGKALASTHDCKFIETSSGIEHNVDELLVGIMKQCRLRDERLQKQLLKKRKSKESGKRTSRRTSVSLQLAKEILEKLCLNDSKSKSCENLHVL